MKHTHNRKAMRILSVVLLVTMFVTSGTFTMYASELPVIVNEFIASAQPSAATVSSEPRLIPDDTFALLQRMSEYDSFTEEEKEKIYDLLGDAYDREALVKAEEDQELYRVRFEQMPEEAKKEGTVRWLINDYGTYSGIPLEERVKLFEILDINSANYNNADALFTFLEQKNIGLFDSYLIVDIMADGVFTLEEALELYNDFPDRTVRDSNVFAFKKFISNFEKPFSVISNDLTVESMSTILAVSVL